MVWTVWLKSELDELGAVKDGMNRINRRRMVGTRYHGKPLFGWRKFDVTKYEGTKLMSWPQDHDHGGLEAYMGTGLM